VAASDGGEQSFCKIRFDGLIDSQAVGVKSAVSRAGSVVMVVNDIMRWDLLLREELDVV
jgi:hypothetical protein